MPNYTTGLGLAMPDYAEAADIKVINDNMLTIDSAIVTLQTNVEGVQSSITSLTTSVGGKVSKTGDTMTGDLFVQKATGAAFRAKSDTYNISNDSKNGTTTARTLGQFVVVGSNGEWVSNDWAGLAANSSSSSNEYYGSVKRSMSVRNIKTDGTDVTNTFTIGIKKDGSRWYAVSDAAAFRSAIGAMASADIATVGDARYLKMVPASTADLPQSTATSGVFPIVLGNNFANNGRISYMTTANFKTLLGIVSTSASNEWGGVQSQVFSGNKNWSCKDTAVDLKLAANGLSNTTRYHEWLSYDKNGYIPGGVTNLISSGGYVQTILRARNYKTGTTTAVSNSITLSVEKDGTRSVSVDVPAAWRTALGLGAAATMGTGTTASTVALGNHTHAGSAISSGSVAVANGGTGATTAAAARTNLGITTANIGAANAPTQLYSSTTGTKSSITISTLGNYNHLRIFFVANSTYGSGDCGSVDVYRTGSSWGNGGHINVSAIAGHEISATESQISIGLITVGPNYVSPALRGYVNFKNNSAPAVGSDYNFYIYRIEGWT